MNTLEITPPQKMFFYDEYIKRSASESDIKVLFKEDTLLTSGGRPIILYTKVDFSIEALRNKLREIKYDESERTRGIKTTSRTFGYKPRVTIRRDFCTSTKLTAQESETNSVIIECGKKIAEIYKKYFPTTYDYHERKVRLGDVDTRGILPEWQIEGTPFTSGIINKDNPLKYHFDSGNVKGVCSCMLALRRDISGGHLACPELGIGFEIADRSLLIFDGQSILHGVTPIHKMSVHAHRFTVVYYTLQQMWKCEPLNEELARVRRIKSEREIKRAGLGR